MDVLFQRFLTGQSEVPRASILPKESRSDFVHAFIGALRRKNGGDQQLKQVLVLECALGMRKEPIERRESTFHPFRRAVSA